MRMPTNLLFLLIMACFISGCANLHVPHTSAHFTIQSPSVRQVQLAFISRWEMRGAFSIQQLGQQPVIANYQWQQYAKNYRINISSVLNVYTIKIIKQNNLVLLFKNEALISQAKTPEQLMQKALGWSLPINALSNWIKGLPAPGKYRAQYDVFGHVMLLQQLGWRIRYSQYADIHGVDFPEVIYLQQSRLKAKIVIKQIIFHPQFDTAQ